MGELETLRATTDGSPGPTPDWLHDLGWRAWDTLTGAEAVILRRALDRLRAVEIERDGYRGQANQAMARLERAEARRTEAEKERREAIRERDEAREQRRQMVHEAALRGLTGKLPGPPRPDRCTCEWAKRFEDAYGQAPNRWLASPPHDVPRGCPVHRHARTSWRLEWVREEEEEPSQRHVDEVSGLGITAHSATEARFQHIEQAHGRLTRYVEERLGEIAADVDRLHRRLTK